MHTVKSIAYQLHLTEIIERAFSFHPRETGHLWDLPVVYNPRLSSRAGQYNLKPPCIDLHVALPGPKCTYREHTETFLHELAHAMEHAIYNSHGHGVRWYESMHQLGQQPVPTHRIAACNNHPSVRTKDTAEDLDL